MKKLRKFKKWVDSKVNWSNLKLFGQHKFVASMYIWLFMVPIIANGLRGLDDIFPITIFNHTFMFNSSLPFSWQAFFYSALSFTLANIIRFTFCPRIITDHSDYANFKGSEKNKMHLVEYEKEFERAFQVHERQKNLNNRYNNNNNEDVISVAFWGIHKNVNSTHILFQYICKAPN